MDEIYAHSEYDAVLRRDLGSVRTVVDLGANIGLSVRLWAARFPSARVIAVEPDGENMRMCRLNVPGGAGGRVFWFQGCAAGVSREVGLDRSSMEWAFRMRDRAGNEPGIAALSVPDLLSLAGVDGPIDLFKCDIEGAERELFSSCSAWLGRVRFMVVETHAPYRAEDFLADIGRNGGGFRHTVFKESADVAVLMLARTEEPVTGTVAIRSHA